MTTIQEIIQGFNTVPFLFVGSGLSRRYYNLPNWENLLKHFAEKISDDRFAYNSYLSKAKVSANNSDILPLTASLIQKDFDEKWFNTPSIRTLDEGEMKYVENKVSPFKVEVASYIKHLSQTSLIFTNEVNRLKNLSHKNLAGIITTNYDCFFDNLFKDYKVFIGQDELCFSAIQGIAETYKIHGSISKPESIVINSEDYKNFKDKSKYLAAKLMTIFMEYPIIFIGYSLTDSNIKNILQDIVDCLPDDKIQKLQERFVFIDWKEGYKGYSVDTYALYLNDKLLSMTKITLDDYSLLYDALLLKKAAMPVKILRRFKDELYSYVISAQPTPLMHVASIDNESLNEDNLAISIGISNTGEYGLKNVLTNESWYRDIVMDDLNKYGFNYDDRLTYSFDSVFKGSGNSKLPVYKYLANAKKEYPNVKARGALCFDDLLNNTIKTSSKKIQFQNSSVKELYEKEELSKALNLMCYLPENKISISELEEVLKSIFEKDPKALSNKQSGTPTHIRRLIRIYDYLKWGKIKNS